MRKRRGAGFCSPKTILARQKSRRTNRSQDHERDRRRRFGKPRRPPRSPYTPIADDAISGWLKSPKVRKGFKPENTAVKAPIILLVHQVMVVGPTHTEPKPQRPGRRKAAVQRSADRVARLAFSSLPVLVAIITSWLIVIVCSVRVHPEQIMPNLHPRCTNAVSTRFRLSTGFRC